MTQEGGKMNEHMKGRLLDVAYVGVLALIGWALFTGYVLMSTVNSFYKGQCGIAQDQAVAKAVEERLAERVEEELKKRMIEEGAKGEEQ